MDNAIGGRYGGYDIGTVDRNLSVLDSDRNVMPAGLAKGLTIL